MGMYHDKVIVQPTHSRLPNRNYFIAGGPGSAKTQSFVITNVLHEKQCSIVVTDPKGEVYESTAEIKRKQGYEVHVVNFMQMNGSDRYNPFDYVRTEMHATTVANTIVASKNDVSRKDFWYFAQFSLLKALILYAIYELPPKERNMSGILSFLQGCDTEGKGDSTLDAKFDALPLEHPARRAYELGFQKSVDKTRSNIVISLLTTITDFVSDSVAHFTSFSDFFLGDIGKRKIALYVIIPVMDTTWEGLINLFFNQMFQELYDLGAKNGAKLPQPVLFILDEFPNLGKFPDYEKFLATCRGYGIGVCTIVQNITQLYEEYGKEQGESILGNCGVKICLGNVNNTTADYWSNLCGKTTVKVDTEGSSSSRGRNASSSTSQNYTYVQRQLINADEIITMVPDQSLVVITGKHPIKLRKAYQHVLFPGLIEKHKVSQMVYKNHPTQEVLDWFAEKEKEFREKLDAAKAQYLFLLCLDAIYQGEQQSEGQKSQQEVHTQMNEVAVTSESEESEQRKQDTRIEKIEKQENLAIQFLCNQKNEEDTE